MINSKPRFYINPITGRLIKSNRSTFQSLKKRRFRIDGDACFYNTGTAKKCFEKLLKLYPDLVYPSSNFINIPKTFKHGRARAFVKHKNKIIGFIDKKGKKHRLNKPIHSKKELPIIYDSFDVLPNILKKHKPISPEEQYVIEKQIAKSEPLSNININILFNPLHNDFIPTKLNISDEEKNYIINTINQHLLPNKLPPISRNLNISGILKYNNYIIGFIDLDNKIQRFSQPIKIIELPYQSDAIKQIPSKLTESVETIPTELIESKTPSELTESIETIPTELTESKTPSELTESIETIPTELTESIETIPTELTESEPIIFDDRKSISDLLSDDEIETTTPTETITEPTPTKEIETITPAETITEPTPTEEIETITPTETITEPTPTEEMETITQTETITEPTPTEEMETITPPETITEPTPTEEMETITPPETITEPSEVETISQPEPSKEIETVTETISEPEPSKEVETVTETISEPEPSEEVETVTETISEPEPSEEVEAVTETISEPEPSEEIEAITETISEPEPSKEVETITETISEPEPSKEVETVTETISEPEPSKEIETITETISEPEPSKEVETISEPEPEPSKEVETITETISETPTEKVDKKILESIAIQTEDTDTIINKQPSSQETKVSTITPKLSRFVSDASDEFKNKLKLLTISKKITDTLPSIETIKKEDKIKLDEYIQTTPILSEKETQTIVEKIKCLDGEQFDQNEKRCLPCTYYELIWDPEFKMCKPILKEKVVEKKDINKMLLDIDLKGLELITDDKQNIIGYIQK